MDGEKDSHTVDDFKESVWGDSEMQASSADLKHYFKVYTSIQIKQLQCKRLFNLEKVEPYKKLKTQQFQDKHFGLLYLAAPVSWLQFLKSLMESQWTLECKNSCPVEVR